MSCVRMDSLISLQREEDRSELQAFTYYLEDLN